MSKTVQQTRPRSWLWLHGLLCGAAISIIPASCVVGAVLFAPVIAALILEPTPNKPVTRAMGLLTAATAVQPLELLWGGANSLQSALAIVGDPTRVTMSWIAAGSGWLISEGTTMAALHLGGIMQRRRQAALQRERSSIEEEWGLDAAETHEARPS